ncbi:thiamine pyrophosphate-dependent enzyme [Mycobacterium neglectum]|uniref:thiamine pyrophosphate-dependent enzyme n=1 Tax=Mycobacterium neglectum TaxID=242737 RepID=UPI000BFEDBF3|nr:thiamine pyrophosphate-dependent enzyme [Mycobacterium neglectum]
MSASRLAGHAVVEQLVALGADRAFGVPGESYLAVLDGLHDHTDELPFVVARQEGGAAMMAAAHGQLTGRPGIAMVTRGPGATNASIGVHVASQDSSPMLLLVGQVPTTQLGTRAFQEVDYRQMFGGLAKGVVELNEADRVCEQVARAWTLANAGEPGPVVVVMPEDVLSAETDCVPLPAPVAPVSTVGADGVEQIRDILAQARRPLVVVSGNAWSSGGRAALRGLAEKSDLPVATATRRQDIVDNRSEIFVGTVGLQTTPGLSGFAAQADVVLLLGGRPDGLTAEDGDWLTAGPAGRRLLHVYPDPDVLGSVYPADVAMAARPDDVAEALAAALVASPLPRSEERTEWGRRLRQHRVALRAAQVGPLHPGAFMAALAERVAPDAVLTAGAGVYTGWHQQHRDYIAYPSQVASHSGSMGYGLPAAIAAAFALPSREVVAFAGDGCFLMNGQELSTAVRYGLGITVVVVSNGVYGTIRRHQERRFPGRPSGTDLQNPDFAALARAHGAWAATARTPAEFGAALGARPVGQVCLVELDLPETDAPPD